MHILKSYTNIDIDYRTVISKSSIMSKNRNNCFVLKLYILNTTFELIVKHNSILRTDI